MGIFGEAEMRTRIRSVKPEFFRHEELFKLEKSTGLPMRIAFSGLWVCADREGRFEWKPNLLKLDVLPWDEVDFAVVLEKLREAGFIEHYEIGAKQYGYIPGWHSHQVIPTKEAPSHFPPPPGSSREIPDSSQGAPEKITGAHNKDSRGREGEGKGTEGEREREGECKQPPAPDLVFLWNENSGGDMPRVKQLTDKRREAWRRRWMNDPDEAYWIAVIRRMAASPFCRGENDRGWRANVDFLLKPETHVRVMEGRYDPGPVARRRTRADDVSESNKALYAAVERGEV